MDYAEIGRRIRKYRKLCGYSQEELAEKVNISPTHMSHIETGGTKLSLPVLVDIAATLQIQTDHLLRDTATADICRLQDEAATILASCTVEDANMLVDILRTVRQTLERHK